jgi:hypothetical protein
MLFALRSRSRSAPFACVAVAVHIASGRQLRRFVEFAVTADLLPTVALVVLVDVTVLAGVDLVVDFRDGVVFASDFVAAKV